MAIKDGLYAPMRVHVTLASLTEHQTPGGDGRLGVQPLEAETDFGQNR